MANYSKEQLMVMSPREFRNIVRKGEWTDRTHDICGSYVRANLAIVPKEYAFEFLLFCQRNPRPCPVMEVTDPGDPHPKQMAPEADLRTDLPKYRVYQDGELIDEPNDIIKYWRDDLVGFLIGCSGTFVWALRAANLSWREYDGYCTNIPCVPAGRLHGYMWVTVRAFYNAEDAVRAVQISSRHPAAHGAPVYIGDPADIGIKNLGKADPANKHPAVDPPKPGEIVMCWGCGVTPESVARESKVPFMITHFPGHMFITDRLVEEMAVI